MLWEAQFGDFVNGAQIIIDQFIVAAEDKWGQTSRPRAAAAARLRGPGPRALARPASSASSRCAPRTTSRSCNATTAAQYFHLLRRQVRREVRKPLVHVHAEVAAADEGDPLADRASSRTGSFQEVLDDPASPIRPRCAAIVFCSRQGRVRRDRRARRASARRSRSCASSSSTRSRSEQLLDVLAPLPERRRGGLAAGGAREHGAVALHVRPQPRDQGTRATTCATCPASSPAARRPARAHPRPGARRPARRDLRRPVGRSVRPAGSRRPLRDRRGLAAGRAP